MVRRARRLAVGPCAHASDCRGAGRRRHTATRRWADPSSAAASPAWLSLDDRPSPVAESGVPAERSDLNAKQVLGPGCSTIADGYPSQWQGGPLARETGLTLLKPSVRPPFRIIIWDNVANVKQKRCILDSRTLLLHLHVRLGCSAAVAVPYHEGDEQCVVEKESGAGTGHWPSRQLCCCRWPAVRAWSGRKDRRDQRGRQGRQAKRARRGRRERKALRE